MLHPAQLSLTARSAGQGGTDYLPLEPQGLEGDLRWERPAGKPCRVILTLENRGQSPWVGVVRLELRLPARHPRFLLPGFLYGRNRGEAPLGVPRKFPRLRRGEPDFPASSWWMVRSDQLTHPAALVWTETGIYGLMALPFLEQQGEEMGQTLEPKGPFQFAGFSCRLEAEGAVLGYTLGYENAPWLFIQSSRVQERKPLGENCLRLAPGARVRAVVELLELPDQALTGFYTALEQVYQRFHRPPRQVSGTAQAIRQLAWAVSRDAWLPQEGCYSGFVRQDGQGGFTYNPIPSLTWTNGLTVAVPLLMAADVEGWEEMRAQALLFLRDVVANSLNPASGLPFEAKVDGRWQEKGWWYDGMHTGGHSGYLAGQAVYYLLKAYHYERETRALDHPDWLAFARGVLERIQQERNRQGEYPFACSVEDGTGLEYDSMGGVWCLAAWAYYCALTGERAVLPQLAESERHYYEKYVARGECYGGPLDTDKAVDNEAILAYLRAVRWLHQLTGEDRYLAHLRDGICYQCSFQFCYNVPVQTPPLSKVGWSSCGGSVTSVANPHIHPMSVTTLGEMAYYVDQTGDPYVAQRLEDMRLWGCQTYHLRDGEYDYGREGWMSERFCYGQGLLVERYPDGSPASTWFALMPWAACSVVEGLVDLVHCARREKRV